MILRIFFVLVALLMPSQTALGGEVCFDERSGIRDAVLEAGFAGGSIAVITPDAMPGFLEALNKKRDFLRPFTGDAALIVIDVAHGSKLYLHRPHLYCRQDPRDLRAAPEIRLMPKVPA